MQGEPGTDITFTVVRDIKSFDITITRKKFKTQNLVASILPPGDIAFIEIKKITSDIANQLKEKLTTIRDKNVTKLILDLRNNTGGIVIDSLKITELFLPEKNILLRIISRSDTPQNFVSSNKEPFDFEIVVLVNKKTASASEIIVGALQDSKKATIVGTRTYGKAILEKTFKLQNNYRVKFISGALYTPLGRSWQSKGLTPDFIVDQEEKTYLALTKLLPIERLQKDIGLVTAYKLVNR